jgi:hypothetical protein
LNPLDIVQPSSIKYPTRRQTDFRAAQFYNTEVTMGRFLLRVFAAAALAMGLAVMPAWSQTTAGQTPPPAPKPFPQPGQPAPSNPGSKPPAPAPTQVPAQTTAPATPGTPNEASLGVQPYPTAEFLGSYDVGKGQRLYLYGTNMGFLDVVGFYKTTMKSGGREIFKAPATQQFDFPGVKFVEETMALVPGVVVKDYTWGGSDGYLHVDGTTEKRFKTIIQIVPVVVR